MVEAEVSDLTSPEPCCACARPRGRDRDPLRRWLRQVDRGSQARPRRPPLRLVLLHERDRVAGGLGGRSGGGDRVWWDHLVDRRDARTCGHRLLAEAFLSTRRVNGCPCRSKCAGEREPCRVRPNGFSDEGVTISEVRFGRDAGGDARLGAGRPLGRDQAGSRGGAGRGRALVEWRICRLRRIRHGPQLVALSEHAEPRPPGPGGRPGRGGSRWRTPPALARERGGRRRRGAPRRPRSTRRC